MMYPRLASATAGSSFGPALADATAGRSQANSGAFVNHLGPDERLLSTFSNLFSAKTYKRTRCRIKRQSLHSSRKDWLSQADDVLWVSLGHIQVLTLEDSSLKE